MWMFLGNLIAQKGVFKTTSPSGEEFKVATLQGFDFVFSNIVTAILGIAGIVLFLMLVVGGFRYITAGDDPKAVEQARKTLTYSIGGFVLIAAAFLILRIIEEITGAPLTEFTIVGQ